VGGQGAQVRPARFEDDDIWQKQLAAQQQQTAQALSQVGKTQVGPRTAATFGAAQSVAPMLGPASVASAAASNFGGLQQGAQAQQQGAQQQALIGQLQQAAAGQGPSLANYQIGQGVGAALAAQNAAAASARGANAGTMMRQAANQAANIEAQGAVAAGQQRIQEQQAAQQALGSVLQNARQQNLDLGAQQAQMGLQNSQFNASNQQQANLANQGAANQVMLQGAANQQQTSLANQQALNAAAAANALAKNQTGTENQALALQQQQDAQKQKQALMAFQNALTGQSWDMNKSIMDSRQQSEFYNAGATDRGNASDRQTAGNIGAAMAMLAMMA
jgi:hypothetical protein